MASIHGKNALSFRKTRTSSKDCQSPVILQDYKFAHESAGGETSIDLDALVTPTSINTGIINPVGGQLAAINLKNNSNSIIIISSDKGTLQQGSWQISNSGRQIQLAFTTEPNEIFTVQVRTTQATANVVDADAFAITGTLFAGDVDIPLGQVFTLNANPTEQIGEVILTIDGVEQLRNMNNAVADPLADGNYQEVESGSNQMNLLRLNESFPVDVAYSVKSNGLIVNAEPNNSHTQAYESLGGQLDALIPTVADLAGVPESNFQAAPNSVDLKAFSDRVYENKDNIESNDADILALQNKVDTGAETVSEFTKTKFQTKFLGGNVSTNGVDLTPQIGFNNLEIGKFYRLSGQFSAGSNVAGNAQASLVIECGGQTVINPRHHDDDTTSNKWGINTIFEAQGNTLTVVSSISGGDAQINGNGTRFNTFFQLEELPNHEETSQWN